MTTQELIDSLTQQNAPDSEVVFDTGEGQQFSISGVTSTENSIVLVAGEEYFDEEEDEDEDLGALEGDDA